MKPLQTPSSKRTTSFAQKVITLLKDNGDFTSETEKLFKNLQRNARGRALSELLVDAGIEESSVQQSICEISGIKFHQLDESEIAMDIVDQIGYSWCAEHGVLPVRLDQNLFVIASSMENFFHADDLLIAMGETVEQLLTTKRSIRLSLEFLEKSQARETENEGSDEEASFFIDDCLDDESVDLEAATADADSSPVVSLVSTMISTAVREDASDIHFEPRADHSVMRYRIDGILHDLMQAESAVHSAIVSRIKILANLDIAERRIPQDGRIRATVLGRSIDLRVSTVPTPKGEKVVLRLLDDKNIRIGLDDLGFEEETLNRWVAEIENPHGIILVTGPTGCGKTTTLYSSLQKMDRERLNISTVEDPVEYELDGITQIQVHEKIDMTFSKALRALLRQDPDVCFTWRNP